MEGKSKANLTNHFHVLLSVYSKLCKSSCLDHNPEKLKEYLHVHFPCHGSGSAGPLLEANGALIHK